MSTVVHGFRSYTLVRCRKTKRLTLKGQLGMHLHQNPSKRAECRGPTASAQWMPQETKEKIARWQREREAGQHYHDPLDVPYFDCSCGYYVYRHPVESDKQPSLADPFVLFAHVTAIGKYVLHQDGARVQRYRLDYFLRPKQDVEVWVYSDSSFDYSYYTPSERVSLIKAMEEIAAEFGVPILDEQDSHGCHICQLVNGWVQPEDMRTVVTICSCANRAMDERHGDQMREFEYQGHRRLWQCRSCGRLVNFPTTVERAVVKGESHG